MALTRTEKEVIITDFAIHEGDTGSAQVQIAMLTRRIQQLTEHLKNHTHDNHSKRGLLKLVGQRRRHLRFARNCTTCCCTFGCRCLFG